MSKVDAKIFKVRFEVEKFQSARGRKNFQSGLRPNKISKSLRPNDLETGQENFLSAEAGQSVHKQVEIRFPVSELGPRVAQRAQVAEVATYYNAVWQC